MGSIKDRERANARQVANIAINRIEGIKSQVTPDLKDIDPIRYNALKGDLEWSIINNRRAVVNLGLIKWHEGMRHVNSCLSKLNELKAADENRKQWSMVSADAKRVKEIQAEPKPAKFIEAEQTAAAAVENMNAVQAELLNLSALLGEVAPDGTMTTEEFEKAILEFRKNGKVKINEVKNV